MKTTEKISENKEAVTGTEIPEKLKTPKAVKAAGDERQEARIYIGPTLKGVTITGTVYNGDLPPALKEAIHAIPVMKELVVPISQLIETNRKLADQNSALSKFYELAAKQEGRTK